MPIELSYLVVKDLISLAKMKKAAPINAGKLDVDALAAKGLVDVGSAGDCRWARPDRLCELTEGTDASHEIVWVTDKRRRTKRQIVRLRRGTVDSVLVRKMRN